MEIPSIVACINDLVAHRRVDDLYKECNSTSFSELPADSITSISLLACLELFIEKDHDDPTCVFKTTAETLDELPWCEMTAHTAHSLKLIRVFALATSAWTLNALLDPIIYALWYPVFRNNLKELWTRIRRRKNGG